MKKLIIILLLLLPVSAFGAIFYCDCSVSGGTGGAGSYADPFESIADIEAYEVATGFTNGDDIYFLEGSTCTATSDWDIQHVGVDSNNYSMFSCYDAEDSFDCDGTRPIIQMSTTTQSMVEFKLKTEYVHFKHLHFKNTHPNSLAPGSMGNTGLTTETPNLDGGYIIIEDCRFDNWGHYAIKLSSVGTNVKIVDNDINANGNGIYFLDDGGAGASYGYVARNTCDGIVGYDTGGGAVDGHCVGLMATNNMIVEDNIATDVRDPFALYISNGEESSFNVRRNNKVYTADVYGMAIDGSDTAGHSSSYSNLIYGNIFKDTTDGSSTTRDCTRVENVKSSNGNYVFNNTCYGSKYHGFGVKNGSAGATDYVYFYNNIVHVDGITSNNKLSHFQSTGGSNFFYDNNLYWASSDPSAETLWQDHNGSVYDFSDWQGTALQDANGDVVDPDFINTTEFELKSSSPAIDAGTWLTHVTSATGSGATVNVDNNYCLHDDMGIKDQNGNAISGMLISLYDSTNGRQDREITGITYGTSITLNSNINWIYDVAHPDDPVYTTQIALRFYGAAPDIGAVQYEGEAPPPSTGDITGLTLH
jgi:hypothetical protein